MSKKRNTEFLEAYVTFETVCSEKFGLKSGGATEYINILIREHGAPQREVILPKLVDYRNIRNRMAHENGALAKIKDIDSSDVRWLKKFTKSVIRKKDPVSLYMNKNSKHYALKKFITGFTTAVICTAIIALIALIASGIIKF